MRSALPGVVLAGMLAASAAAESPEMPVWHDLDPGLAKAARTGRPALLWLHDGTCGPCRETFLDTDVTGMLPDFVLIAAPGRVAEQYGAVPGTVLLLEPSGTPVAELILPLVGRADDRDALLDLMSSGLDILR